MLYSESFKDKIFKIHQTIHKNLVNFFRVALSDAKDYSESPQFHYDVSDILLHDNRSFAIEMFRDSAKSSLVLMAFPCYKLTYPTQDTRYMVIIKQNATLARAKLKEIVTTYTSNKVLSANLVRVIKNSADAFEAIIKNKEGKETKVRIEAYGKGSSIRGLNWDKIRPQIIILDDIQDLKDSESETVLENDWNWFLADVMFLSKTGRIFLIGNNLGKKCVVEQVIDSGELGFQSLRLAAIDDNGNSTWPGRYPISLLEEEKRQYALLGKLDIWYRERMCMAIAPETQKFRQEYFKDFEESDLMAIGDFDIDVTIDPAISKKKEACNSAIVAVGKSIHLPDWFVLDYKFGKWTPYELIEATFELNRELKLLYPRANIWFWVEGVAYQEALKYVFEEEMRKRREYLYLDTFIDKTDKERRILQLVPLWRVGIIHTRSWMIQLKEEALLFPKGKTVDVIDALALQAHVKMNTTDDNSKEKEQNNSALGQLQGIVEQMQSSHREHDPIGDSIV